MLRNLLVVIALAFAVGAVACGDNPCEEAGKTIKDKCSDGSTTISVNSDDCSGDNEKAAKCINDNSSKDCAGIIAACI